MSTLYLVRGLPGSGKTTFAKNQFRGVFHVENDMFHMKPYDFATCSYCYDDEFRIERSGLCFDTAMKILFYNVPVIVSNVFVTKESVERYQKYAISKGHDVVIFRMKSQFKNEHSTPKEILKWMTDNFADITGEHLVTPISDSGSYFIS